MTGTLSMEIAIYLGGTLLAFLTMIVLRLGALFLPRIAVLVGGSKLCPGDVVRSFCALAVLHKGLNICGLRIETLRNQHCLVGSWRLFGKIVKQFRLVKHLRVLKERWQLSHP